MDRYGLETNYQVLYRFLEALLQVVDPYEGSTA